MPLGRPATSLPLAILRPLPFPLAPLTRLRGSKGNYFTRPFRNFPAVAHETLQLFVAFAFDEMEIVIPEGYTRRPK
jgi:hypothetical protein